MSTNSKFRYSYRWAADTVQSFVEKYTRGWYFLAKIFDTSPGHTAFQLAVILAKGNSLKWEVMKNVVKSLEHYGWADLEALSPKDRVVLYRCLRTLAEDDALDAEKARFALDTLRQGRLF